MKGSSVTTVLIVDNDADELEKYTSIVKGAECNVRTASGGHKALYIMRSRPRDIRIIICDVDMRDGDGVAFVAAMVGECIRTPILLHSARERRWHDGNIISLPHWIKLQSVGFGPELAFNCKLGRPTPEEYIAHFLARNIATTAHQLAAE